MFENHCITHTNSFVSCEKRRLIDTFVSVKWGNWHIFFGICTVFQNHNTSVNWELSRICMNYIYRSSLVQNVSFLELHFEWVFQRSRFALSTKIAWIGYSTLSAGHGRAETYEMAQQFNFHLNSTCRH